jgi:hypothetical protein
MPCRSEGYGNSNSEIIREQREQLDRVTRILCELLTNAEAKGDLVTNSTECLQWWDEHKKADEERRKREQWEEESKENERQRKIALVESELRRLKGGK